MIPLQAIFLLVASTALYALCNVLMKRASQSISPFLSMSVSMFVLFLASIICAFVFERNQSWDLTKDPGALKALFIVGIVNAIGFWCYLEAFKHVTVWQYEMFTLLTPIFAAILAFIILGETFPMKMFAGLGIVGVGLLVAFK